MNSKVGVLQCVSRFSQSFPDFFQWQRFFEHTYCMFISMSAYRILLHYLNIGCSYAILCMTYPVTFFSLQYIMNSAVGRENCFKILNCCEENFRKAREDKCFDIHCRMEHLFKMLSYVTALLIVYYTVLFQVIYTFMCVWFLCNILFD